MGGQENERRRLTCMQLGVMEVDVA